MVVQVLGFVVDVDTTAVLLAGFCEQRLSWTLFASRGLVEPKGWVWQYLFYGVRGHVCEFEGWYRTNLHEYSQVVIDAIVRPDESFILARFFGDIPEEISCRRWRSFAQVVQKECLVGNKSLKHALIRNFEQGSVIFSSPCFARCMSQPCMQDRWYRALTFPALWTLDPWVGLHVGIGLESRQIGHTCISHKFTDLNVCSQKYTHSSYAHNILTSGL